MLTLPHTERIELPGAPLPALAGALDRILASGVQDGYVRASVPGGEAFVFIHNGRAYCAGSVEDGRFVARSITDTVCALTEAKRAFFVRTDLPLFLCTAVLFRKAPAAQLPLDLVDSESLLRHLKEAGQDAVIVVRRRSAYNLVFCREGEPVVLYAAAGERFVESGALSERMLEYCYQSPSEVALDLYHDIGLHPAADAGKALSAYLTSPSDAPSAAPPSLLIHLGGRVVFRFPVPEGELLVGRGSDNDVPLDNLSVSRRHARLYRDGDRIVIEDRGSENGLVFRKERVARAELSPGDQVEVGKYSLTYPRYTSREHVVAPSPRVSFVGDTEETVAIGRAEGAVEIEHAGQRYPMRGPLFHIGSDGDAHIRVTGFFVGGVHARIKRTVSGYSVERVGGLLPLTVNGKKIKDAPLVDGDELHIGRHIFRFRQSQPKAPVE